MSKKIQYMNTAEFEELLKNSDKPIILDFFSDDCPPCDVLAPIYEKMAEKYGDYISFAKIMRQDNRELALRFGVTGSPTVLFFKNGEEIGSRLSGFMTKPQVRKAIEEILGDVIPPSPIQRIDCDLLILGGGPAGLTAGLYAGRAKLNTVIVEESICGGQAASTNHIANYPGTEGAINGKVLTENMKNQALSFGVRIDDLKEIFEVKLEGTEKYIRTEDTEYYAKAIILATGSRPRALEAAGAEERKGRGVHYCATCDGAMYEGADVIVIGGGSAAIEEAVFLTRFADHVTIVHRRDGFRAAQIELDEARENDKITILTNKVVKEVVGGEFVLKEVVLKDVKTGKEEILKAAGAFVYVGNDPQTQMFKDQVNLDEMGYIIASEDTKTNVPGVFAAGDVRTKSVRQVATATSDGAIAAIMAEKYLVSLK
ncbi:thioredoxin-disulfide reductase [Sinanaerobacter chloroacetimidivorans]|uniref:Thioredoxin reductase n=1 Tax=Sinanaerobacter chloroacetimidivorans TaxID=2818044 RepID=A0A8J7W0H6_9FIRM|nr:thioredoxin-disulfide reductase [Sinanaerobacter chloroacetimidivorans]MBR0598529.1 thioredoxin-disulfide reductase [Sinanaerobacter chloroacetimidivorans]